MFFRALLPLAVAALLFTVTHGAVGNPQLPPKGKSFDHILIIVLENTNYALAASDSILTSLSQQGIVLTNYHALTHPSQPNYIASIAGDYYGLNNDIVTTIPANYTTIVDLLEQKHLTWKTYQEDMPDVCAAQSEVSGLYFQKHNPFVVHQSIAKNATRCKNVVPATQLSADLAAAAAAAAAASTAATTGTSGGASAQLPNYMYYTPNMINDGHNTTVRDATKWLSTFLPSLLFNPAYQASNTLLVITFDETEDYFIQDNLVYTLLLGSSDSVIPAALKNTTHSTPITPSFRL
ncbi:hypothetical protein BGX33_001483 [Mortierella sp. NVP41]|nr:hypothetical protein BGX33_001483 [Mortierella sp. NVP41]